MIEWLQKWYPDHCDGDWEPEYGIKISNIDNPGWTITIDLAYTELDGLDMPYVIYENSDQDWYGYSIENMVFKGVGNPSKLNKILETFNVVWQSKLK